MLSMSSSIFAAGAVEPAARALHAPFASPALLDASAWSRGAGTFTVIMLARILQLLHIVEEFVYLRSRGRALLAGALGGRELRLGPSVANPLRELGTHELVDRSVNGFHEEIHSCLLPPGLFLALAIAALDGVNIEQHGLI